MTPADLLSGTSFDHIERHASATPDRIAITGPAGDISWEGFRADAARFTHAIGQLGVRPGQIAAISYPDYYVHWLLSIACENAGAIFAPFAAGDPTDKAGPLLDLADIVLAASPLARDNAHLLDEAWVAGVFAAPDPPKSKKKRAATRPDDPLRIVRTSGSTGEPKCMVLPRKMQSRAVANVNFRSTPPRYYEAYPLNVNPCHYRMEACLRLGGTTILGKASQDILTYRATECWLLPRDMARLLQGVRGRWPASRPFHVSLGGGPVSAALHDDTATLLGTEVQIYYATNETGFVGLLDRDGNGTLLPGVELKIAEEGVIALRTPAMVEGYLNDPEGSAAHFRDGWFFSDDLGEVMPDGRFRILGRRGELLNLGGEKLSPSAIEETLRAKIAGLQDVATTSIANAHGIEEICVAVVAAPSVDRAALLEKVRDAIDPGLGQVWLLALERLPISAAGKLQRSVLRDIFAAMRPQG